MTPRRGNDLETPPPHDDDAIAVLPELQYRRDPSSPHKLPLHNSDTDAKVCPTPFADSLEKDLPAVRFSREGLAVRLAVGGAETFELIALGAEMGIFIEYPRFIDMKPHSMSELLPKSDKHIRDE